IGGQARNNIAALDAATGLATDWDPNASSSVRVMGVNNGTVYVTIFSSMSITIGGASRRYVAALDAATGLATGWNPSPDDYVNTLLFADGMLYAGGNFMNIAGQARNRLAAFDAATGDLAAGWDPNASGSITSLALSGGTMYVSGSFSAIGGVSMKNIAAIYRGSGLVVYP
ncbi:MAG TPA: hypothetical protein PLD91_19220, partial [Spirochaetota bacterium]|nr:hypothetical protein [Spirochaetota bacterium]